MNRMLPTWTVPTWISPTPERANSESSNRPESSNRGVPMDPLLVAASFAPMACAGVGIACAGVGVVYYMVVPTLAAGTQAVGADALNACGANVPPEGVVFAMRGAEELRGPLVVLQFCCCVGSMCSSSRTNVLNQAVFAVAPPVWGIMTTKGAQLSVKQGGEVLCASLVGYFTVTGTAVGAVALVVLGGAVYVAASEAGRYQPIGPAQPLTDANQQAPDQQAPAQLQMNTVTDANQQAPAQQAPAQVQMTP